MLNGVFTPKTTGLYTLRIENTRNAVSATCIYNFIDNIQLVPYSMYQKIYLSVNDCNVSCSSGSTVQFKLLTTNAYPNEYYWILMSVSGTYPGFNLSGITVPLNWDALLEYGLMYLNFPGSVEFFGKLDGFGQATASLTLPPDPNQILVGLPIHFAFVVTSPGPSTPIMVASNPVHIKYVP